MYVFLLSIYFILFNCILVEERYLNLNLNLNLNLGYISNEEKCFKIFVANRVQLIRQ